MNVVHIITDLDDGGAEAVLFRLCQEKTHNHHVVVSLQGMGKYGPLLNELDIKVVCLDFPRGKVTLTGILKLRKTLRELNPDVVQTWMYHADLIGGGVARLSGIRNICWGLHHTTLEKGKVSRSTTWVVRLCALLSGWIPKSIISCSRKGVEVHQSIGYSHEKFVVIPNGHNVNAFKPMDSAGTEVRRTLGLSSSQYLIGLVARFDPQKDHLTFLAALNLLKSRFQNFRCLLVGNNISANNYELMSWINEYGLHDYVLLLGQREDIPAIMNALDIHCLSSYSEAFPNVLCEAMACGTPCITTDVGDSAYIVDSTGWVVPARSPEALAHAIIESAKQCFENPNAWNERKQKARQRVIENFTIEKMVANYEAVWLNN